MSRTENLVKPEVPDEDRFLNWRDERVVTWDVETTGLDLENDRIIQFCGNISKMVGKSFVIESTLSFRFNPEVDIDPGATKAHGVTNEDLEGCPKISDVYEDGVTYGEMIYAYLLSTKLQCFYNGSTFDYPMMANELKRLGIDFPARPWIDLITWYRHKNGLSKSKQEDAARRYGVARMASVAHGKSQLHDAEVDVEVCSALLWKMSSEGFIPYTIEQLVAEQYAETKKHLEYYDKKYGNK